ncbi:hypothetical protein ACMFMG_010762 [Clarireedia jacksonii]
MFLGPSYLEVANRLLRLIPANFFEAIAYNSDGNGGQQCSRCLGMNKGPGCMPPLKPRRQLARWLLLLRSITGANGVPANVFPSALVIAAVLNAPVAATTRHQLFPGTFGSDGLPFSDINQFGIPALTTKGTLIAVKTGRLREQRLVLSGSFSHQTREVPVEEFTPRTAITGRRSDQVQEVIQDFLLRTWTSNLSLDAATFGQHNGVTPGHILVAHKDKLGKDFAAVDKAAVPKAVDASAAFFRMGFFGLG